MNTAPFEGGRLDSTLEMVASPARQMAQLFQASARWRVKRPDNVMARCPVPAQRRQPGQQGHHRTYNFSWDTRSIPNGKYHPIGRRQRHDGERDNAEQVITGTGNNAPTPRTTVAI